MFKTRRRKGIAVGFGVLALVVAAFFWLTRTWTVTAEIRDTAIVLSPDHAGPIVNFELRNVGSEGCDLIVVLTALPVDALPVNAGRVVTRNNLGVDIGPESTPSDGAPIVGSLGQSVRPGDVARLQVAFTRTPQPENLVVLCNGAGEYEAGRRAVLTFER